jgi:hypothetical protein
MDADCSAVISANRHSALTSYICSIVLARDFEQARARDDASQAGYERRTGS